MFRPIVAQRFQSFLFGQNLDSASANLYLGDKISPSFCAARWKSAVAVSAQGFRPALRFRDSPLRRNDASTVVELDEMAGKERQDTAACVSRGLLFVTKPDNPDQALVIIEEGTVFEKGGNQYTAQAVGSPGFMLEHFEFVAVVSVQSILRPKPDESLIILYNLGYFRLRQSIFHGESRETDIFARGQQHRDSTLRWRLLNLHEPIYRGMLESLHNSARPTNLHVVDL